MALDDKMVRIFYSQYTQRVQQARQTLKKPLTYTEKILYSHLYNPADLRHFEHGTDYVNFRPDRVAMQDATAQMALLQFMNAGQKQVAVPASVHCDHLILANNGAAEDLPKACSENREVYDFLQSVAQKYGIGFWKPGAGIIHQVVLENYAFPGGMMVGTDSHTPNAGGLGMAAVGVGGADAVDVLTGQPWELKMPRIIGVRLSGSLSGWASPKDVILELLGRLTVKGGTNALFEYFGPGTESLSTTGKATICNMGAELGATTSVFPYDRNAAQYLKETGRSDIALLAGQVANDLCADPEVALAPEQYYDSVIDIDLSAIEPHLNGPFTPDAAATVSQMKARCEEQHYPRTVEVALIGSCTNSSYEDLARAASVARQALEQGIPAKAQLIINPGSEQIRQTAERDGILDTFKQLGAIIMTNACGPCIGQWKRHTDDPEHRNAIVTSFNRNFRRRADGNPNTFAFIASPELTVALALAGRIDFNPLTDTLQTASGRDIMLAPPQGPVFPPQGFEVKDAGWLPPQINPEKEVVISPESERLQKLMPFAPWEGGDLEMRLLIKAQGKCTTDHISMAGPWLRYRGHLENISQNLLMGAVNAFNGEANCVLNPTEGEKAYGKVSAVAASYKAKGLASIVVAEDNYGEGSSREHAAMEPRFLGVRAILVKSFARIHETNLKKQGLLALTFVNKDDYEKIREDDTILLSGLKDFAPGRNLKITLWHADLSTETFDVAHTYNETQIAWFRAGSALNYSKLQQQ